MVPSRRLIFWVLFAGLPFSLVAGVLPETSAVSGSILCLLAAVGIGDAFLSRRRLRGVELRLEPVVRLQKDRPEMVRVLIADERRRGLVVRYGFGQPPELEVEEQTTSLPAGAPAARTETVMKGLARGRYEISNAYLETSSISGLWMIRKALSINCEARVYPNFSEERKKVAALFLSRGRPGMRVQRPSGKGRDFEKLREYVSGDSYDEIHWRASAKRGHPVTKVFQVERTQEVYVLIDSSRLRARNLGGVQVLDRFLASGLILALAAQQQGDLFGLVTFADRVERFVRARSGKSHYDTCHDALYTLQPRLVSPNFEELASFIRTRLRKRSLLVILTALDDPVLAESFARSIQLVSDHHLVFVNTMQPPGAAPLFSGASVGSSDEIYERLGGHLQWHDLRELEKVLQRRGVTLRQSTHERMTADLVTQYLQVKARQLL